MLIRKIELNRLKNKKKKKNNYIFYMTIIRGDFVTVWYINREREKGNIRYQFNRGLCIGANYKGYNSTFSLRSNIRNVIFEQIFNYYSLNNIIIETKKNTISTYIKNKLFYLRRKKNKESKIRF